jgi:FkbM family methyltransferase
MTSPTLWDEAAAAFAAHDMARLEAIASEILKFHPTHPQGLHMLATALAAQGRSDEALARYRAAVEGLHGHLALTQLGFGLHTLQVLGFRPKGILDIGAFEGNFARLARQAFAQAPILMLEAQPGKEPHLQAAAAGLPDTEYRIVLLGAENREKVAFHQVNEAVNSSGSSLYDEQTRFPRSVVFLPMRTLDDVTAEIPGRDFDMLKIDVQGAEIDVLRGAARTLAGIEVLVIELSLLEYNKGAPLIGEVMAWLEARGFALFDMFAVSRTHAGALLQVDGIFLRGTSRLWPKAPYF